jgi:hypothetical protein
MKGCRPFLDEEVKLIAKSFGGRYATRKRRSSSWVYVPAFASVRCFLSGSGTSSSMGRWWIM